jgi:hypothetical protein
MDGCCKITIQTDDVQKAQRMLAVDDVFIKLWEVYQITTWNDLRPDQQVELIREHINIELFEQYHWT